MELNIRMSEEQVLEEEVSEEEEQAEPGTLGEALAAAFDAADEESVATEEISQNEEAIEETEEAAEEVEAATEEVLDLPVSWPEVERDRWNALPRETQEFVLRRESDFERGVHAKSQEAAKYKRALSAVDSVFAQFPEIEERISATGGNKAKFIESLLPFAAAYERDPIGCARQILQSAGVDPAALVSNGAIGQGQAGPGQQPYDPRVDQLQAQLSHMQQAQQYQQQAAQQEGYQELVGAVQSWATERNDNGELLRPFARDVAPQMQALTSVIRQQKPSATPKEVMQDAYEQAVRANPQVWQVVQQREAKAQEQARVATEREKAQKAKQAGSSVYGKAGPAASQVPASSLRAQLEQALSS
jgi:hypothetical protein